MIARIMRRMISGEPRALSARTSAPITTKKQTVMTDSDMNVA